MKNICIASKLEDPRAAYDHMELEVIQDYGDQAYGNCLYTWDDGKRILCRCRKCGGYVLIQKSEFHSFSDNSSDSYYTDYFFIDGPEEADELNRKYDGFQIENEYKKHYLCITNGRIHWNRRKT